MLFGEYRFLCRLESDALLPPYKGSTFRGVFGLALKRVVCALRREECRDCLLKGRCIYAQVFETPFPDDDSRLSRIATPPHPFVIEPPLTEETLLPGGSSFGFHLLLFGEANHQLPYFIYAFEQMGEIGIGKRVKGKRGRFLLREVRTKKRTIYTHEDRRLALVEPFDSLSLADTADYPAEDIRLRVTMLTPLRLKFQNRLRAELPFHVLVRAMLRRVSSLFNCHGAGEPALDYRGLVKRAEAVRIVEGNLSWFDWRRYSNRQDRDMLMGGIAGSVVYEGRLGEYLPLVDLCCMIHVGKQTTFGLGKIKAEMIGW